MIELRYEPLKNFPSLGLLSQFGMENGRKLIKSLGNVGIHGA